MRKMIDTMKVTELKDALREQNAPLSGNKTVLVERLKKHVGADYIWVTRTQEEVDRESNNATNLEATNSRNISTAATATDSGSVWMIQDGSAITVPEGVNVTEGATEGFLLPTNREGRESFAERKSFLLDKRIERPKFAPKANVQRHKENKDKGGPSRKFALGWNATPLQFFNTQLTVKFRQKCMVEPTNMRASMEGAGSGEKGSSNYLDWKPFTCDDLDGFLGLLIINGLSPKPQMSMWFKSSAVSRMLGNDYLRMRFPNGERRWKHFRRFLQCMIHESILVALKLNVLCLKLRFCCSIYYKTRKGVGKQGKYYPSTNRQ